jgi:hypothetical protein
MANRMSAETVGDRRHRLAAIVCLLGSLWLTGCSTGLLGMPGAALFSERLADKSSAEKSEDAKKAGKSLRRKKEEDNDFGSRVETPLLSEYIGMQGDGLVTLKGVGLVTGLNGQGGDPAPSERDGSSRRQGRQQDPFIPGYGHGGGDRLPADNVPKGPEV